MEGRGVTRDEALALIHEFVKNEALVRHMLAVEAAMRGSRELAVQAYLNDPYCTDIESAPKLVNELIDAQMAVLPAFKGK